LEWVLVFKDLVE